MHDASRFAVRRGERERWRAQQDPFHPSHHEARSGTHDISGLCAPVPVPEPRQAHSTHESPHTQTCLLCASVERVQKPPQSPRLVICPGERQEDAIGLLDTRLHRRRKASELRQQVEPAAGGVGTLLRPQAAIRLGPCFSWALGMGSQAPVGRITSSDSPQTPVPNASVTWPLRCTPAALCAPQHPSTQHPGQHHNPFCWTKRPERA